MKRYEINDFIAEVETDGSLYISADFDFNPKVNFDLQNNGDLYFDDTPLWFKNYFYLVNGEWIWVGEEDEENV